METQVPSDGSSLSGRAGWVGRGSLIEFHRFLIALSVRPGSCFAMCDHLVPICCTSCIISWSSSSVHSSLFTVGHK